MKTDDQRGWVTLWGIGLGVMLLVFGALVVDVWRVLAERQELAGLADSAAIAGATAIDETVFRETGEVALDATGAPDRALRYLADNSHDLAGEFGPVAVVVAGPSRDMLSVTLTKDFEFALIGSIVGESTITFSITAVAQPGERG